MSDEIFRELTAAFREYRDRDKPQITVLEGGPGTLVKVRVEFSDEQIERIRKRPQLGLEIPFRRPR